MWEGASTSACTEFYMHTHTYTPCHCVVSLFFVCHCDSTVSYVVLSPSVIAPHWHLSPLSDSLLGEPCSTRLGDWTSVNGQCWSVCLCFYRCVCVCVCACAARGSTVWPVSDVNRNCQLEHRSAVKCLCGAVYGILTALQRSLLPQKCYSSFSVHSLWSWDNMKAIYKWLIIDFFSLTSAFGLWWHSSVM